MCERERERESVREREREREKRSGNLQERQRASDCVYVCSLAH